MANYSSDSQLRKNVPRLSDVTVLTAADLLLILGESDTTIQTDLSILIDFDLVTAADELTLPIFINKLAQYKTAEMSLVGKFGAKRMVEEQSDRQYWERLYNELLAKILAGSIDLGAFAGTTTTYQNNVKTNVPPALGNGDWGGHIDDDDLETQREDFGND